MRKRLTLCAGALLVAGSLGADTPRPRTLTLTSQENSNVPQDTFSCSGTIHGYLVLPKTAVGKHTVEGFWTKPNGKVAAHTQSEVNFPPPGRSTAYVWFAFPERSVLPGTVDPAQDEERMTYEGQWTLDVRWDEQPLVRESFKVHCL